MAVETKCLTPGGKFHVHILPSEVSVRVEIPGELNISDEQAKDLDSILHNVVELALAPYWNRIEQENPDAV